jgi:hypothetical protein
LSGFEAVGDAMRAIPGPTEAWADIVGHLAWPVTTIFLIVRFREALGVAAEVLASRLATDDVKGFGISLTKPASVVTLAPGTPDPSDPSDANVTEVLFETINRDPDFYGRLEEWVASTLGDEASLATFLAGSDYVKERGAALRALLPVEDVDG